MALIVMEGFEVNKPRKPVIVNESLHDGRQIRGVVGFVSRWLEVNDVVIKINHRTKSYGVTGRAYLGLRSRFGAPSWVYKLGAEHGRNNVVTIHMPRPEDYPRTFHTYRRIGNPEPWVVADWREYLVAILAHELQHVRQYEHKEPGRGRFNEKETDWAAFRLWREWCSKCR